MNKTPPILRIFQKTKRVSDCIYYTGYTDPGGYGSTTVGGKSHRTHRLVYSYFVGPIPDGMFVCHKCDNPSCIRIDHLFVGTHVDNMLDCNRKGRGSSQVFARNKTHCKRGHLVSVGKDGRKTCLACIRMRAAAWARKSRAAKKLQNEAQAHPKPRRPSAN